MRRLKGLQAATEVRTALGRRAGLSDEQLAWSREGRAADAKANAALQFALAVLRHRGGVSNDEFEHVRAAGFSDAEIPEIIAHVAVNVLTNYFNRAAVIGGLKTRGGSGSPVRALALV